MLVWLVKHVSRRVVSQEILAGTEIPGDREEGDYVHNVTQDLRPTMLSVCWFGWLYLLNAKLSLTRY